MLADYTEEIELFEQLLQPEGDMRILLFHGASGMGKTALIEACLDRVPDTVRYVPIELRGSAVTMPEIFQRVGGHVGWDHLHHFSSQVAAFWGTPEVVIDKNWLIGINNRINAVLKAENPSEVAERNALLTEAWYTDLQELEHLFLLAMDTYEAATEEVKQWISGPLLARTARPGKLRVLVAGQSVPDPGIEWRRHCETRQLYGVREAKFWLPILKARGREVPTVPDRDLPNWLAGVCHALDGRPAEILKIIEALPRRRPSA
jgi:hypothetical protein